MLHARLLRPRGLADVSSVRRLVKSEQLAPENRRPTHSRKPGLNAAQTQIFEQAMASGELGNRLDPKAPYDKDEICFENNLLSELNEVEGGTQYDSKKLRQLIKNRFDSYLARRLISLLTFEVLGCGRERRRRKRQLLGLVEVIIKTVPHTLVITGEMIGRGCVGVRAD